MPRIYRRQRRVLSRRKRFGGRFGTSKRRVRSGGVFKKRVKRIIESEAEHKYIDSSTVTLGGSGGSPQFGALNNWPTQGTGVNARIGDKIRIRAIKINWGIQFNNDQDVSRLLIFAYRDQINTPTLSAVLSNSLTDFDSLFSPWNRQNIEDKVVIPMYDRMFVGSYGGGASVGYAPDGIFQKG